MTLRERPELAQEYAEAKRSLVQRSRLADIDRRLVRGRGQRNLAHPVIPGTDGVRKARWSRAGMGKRGGVRVIYFNELEGHTWLLIVYAKAKFDNLPVEFLAKLRSEVTNG